MALFDTYIAVDWSANNAPKLGKDSIWICENAGEPENIRTRYEALSRIKERLMRVIQSGERVLIGFDFAFGYPAGMASRWTGEDHWEPLWALLYDLIEDDARNRSNRFEVAATLNQRLGPEPGPFWGHPWQHGYDGLSPKKHKAAFETLPEWRIAEAHAKGAKSLWQLAYNGAVGSQSLLGIAALEGLRRTPGLADHIAIWPFQTGFADDLSRLITIAEIYPSSHAFDASGFTTVDAAQVHAVTRDFAAWDKMGELKDKLSAPSLNGEDRDKVLREEGWIVGR